MTLLAKFLRLLEWLEAAQDVFEFLLHPLGISAIAGASVYFVLPRFGCDTVSAITLASAAALALYCTLERPRF